MLLKTTEIKIDICRIQAKQNLLHFQSTFYDSTILEVKISKSIIWKVD